MSILLLESAFLPANRADTLFILQNIKKNLNEDLQTQINQKIEFQYERLFKPLLDKGLEVDEEDKEIVLEDFKSCLRIYRPDYIERVKTLIFRAKSASESMNQTGAA